MLRNILYTTYIKCYIFCKLYLKTNQENYNWILTNAYFHNYIITRQCAVLYIKKPNNSLVIVAYRHIIYIYINIYLHIVYIILSEKSNIYIYI